MSEQTLQGLTLWVTLSQWDWQSRELRIFWQGQQRQSEPQHCPLFNFWNPENLRARRDLIHWGGAGPWAVSQHITDKPLVGRMIHSKGLQAKGCHSIAWFMEGFFFFNHWRIYFPVKWEWSGENYCHSHLSLVVTCSPNSSDLPASLGLQFPHL